MFAALKETPFAERQSTAYQGLVFPQDVNGKGCLTSITGRVMLVLDKNQCGGTGGRQPLLLAGPKAAGTGASAHTMMRGLLFEQHAVV